jgi:tRNA/tmRNA/rRNA uracil-C5-methylase (TrmA/RlmC/RlmD family)
MIRSVSIQSLAPTGEGVAKTSDGVGFIAGALPGEEVEAEVLETRRKFWKGRVVSLSNRSPLRRSGAHAEGCAGCDWSHFDVEAAARAKRLLFLETMERIGELPASMFGDLPIETSPLAYRLRSRFHVSGAGEDAAVGYFAPRSHRVESAGACEALSEALRTRLTALRGAVASSGARVSEISIVEDIEASRRLARATLSDEADRREANALAVAIAPLFDGIAVASSGGVVLARSGERRLWISVEGREFPLTPATFFQANRYLVGPLFAEVRRLAAAVEPGRALDLFGGVGLFAGALLDSGHQVVTAEAHHAAVEQALAAATRWKTDAWKIVHAGAQDFLGKPRELFDVIVADPPRAGLGLPLAAALARRPPKLLIYVSCDPATLARDLAALTGSGLSIASARLYDLFPLTHRVEAVIALSASGAD